MSSTMSTINAVGTGPIQGTDFISQAQLGAAAQNVAQNIPGGQLSFSQIESLWINNGGSPGWAPLMAGIAIAESGGNTLALNNNPNTGDYSVGLWQINYFGSLLGPRSAEFGNPSQLQNSPNAQAKAAVSLFGSNGAGIGNWKGDPAYNAWVAAGMPQQPSASSVLGWLSKAGFSAAAGGAGTTFSGPSAAGQPGTCSSKGNGIGAFGVNIGTACQLKALTGGLLIGIGGVALLTGAVLIASYGLSQTKLGKQATAAVTGSVGVVGRTAGAVAGAPARIGTARQARSDEVQYQRYEANRDEINRRNRAYRARQRREEAYAGPGPDTTFGGQYESF